MPPLILVFFYDMNFQIIKINGLDKTRFTQDNFIETIDFDHLEIHVLEED